MYKTMDKRQSEFYEMILGYIGEDNAVNKALAADIAILMSTIENCNQMVNERGEVLVVIGDRGQERFIANPAVAQREAAIKNLNVHVRTIKLDEQVVEQESDLAKFLKK